MELETVSANAPEYKNIMTEIFGDSQHLRVLGFFLEHPFRQFTIVYLHERLTIGRDNLRDILRFYELKGYLVREDAHGPYKLNLKDPMVKAIEKSVMETLGDVVYYEWNNMPRTEERIILDLEEEIIDFGMMHYISKLFKGKKSEISAA